MAIKEQKEILLGLYGGGGSGNADFANMTEEEKMQVRKDLGLYYSEKSPRMFDTLWWNPNEVYEYPFLSQYGNYSRILDEIENFEDKIYNCDTWILAYTNDEGGWNWSNDEVWFQYDGESDSYLIVNNDTVCAFYINHDTTVSEYTIKKGLYLYSYFYAMRLIDLIDGNNINQETKIFKQQDYIIYIDKNSPLNVIEDNGSTYIQVSDVVPEISEDAICDSGHSEAGIWILSWVSQYDWGYYGWSTCWYIFEAYDEKFYYEQNNIYIYSTDTNRSGDQTFAKGIWMQLNPNDMADDDYIILTFATPTTISNNITTAVDHQIEQKYVPNSGGGGSRFEIEMEVFNPSAESNDKIVHLITSTEDIADALENGNNIVIKVYRGTENSRNGNVEYYYPNSIKITSNSLDISCTFTYCYNSYNDNETILISVGWGNDCTYYANYKEIVSGAYGYDESCSKS